MSMTRENVLLQVASKVASGDYAIKSLWSSPAGISDVELHVRLSALSPDILDWLASYIQRTPESLLDEIDERTAIAARAVARDPRTVSTNQSIHQSVLREWLRTKLNPWSNEGWNLTVQGSYVSEYGLEAAQFAAQSVGVRVGSTKPQEVYLDVVLGVGEGPTIRVPILPAHTFEQRLANKLMSKRVYCFKTTDWGERLLRDRTTLVDDHANGGMTLRGFKFSVYDEPKETPLAEPPPLAEVRNPKQAPAKPAVRELIFDDE